MPDSQHGPIHQSVRKYSYYPGMFEWGALCSASWQYSGASPSLVRGQRYCPAPLATSDVGRCYAVGHMCDGVPGVTSGFYARPAPLVDIRHYQHGYDGGSTQSHWSPDPRPVYSVCIVLQVGSVARTSPWVLLCALVYSDGALSIYRAVRWRGNPQLDTRCRNGR